MLAGCRAVSRHAASAGAHYTPNAGLAAAMRNSCRGVWRMRLESKSHIMIFKSQKCRPRPGDFLLPQSVAMHVDLNGPARRPSFKSNLTRPAPCGPERERMMAERLLGGLLLPLLAAAARPAHMNVAAGAGIATGLATAAATATTGTGTAHASPVARAPRLDSHSQCHVVHGMCLSNSTAIGVLHSVATVRGRPRMPLCIWSSAAARSSSQPCARAAAAGRGVL